MKLALSFTRARQIWRHHTIVAIAVVGTLLSGACTPDFITDEDDLVGDGDTGGKSGDGDGDDASGGSGDGDGDVGSGGSKGSGGGDGDGDLSSTGSGPATGGMGGASNPNDPCDNKTLDPGETDVDCGGKDCSPCRIGEDCKVDPDCSNDSCVMGVCQNPKCNDNEQNGSGSAPETDIDCGGSECPACGTDQKCLVASDCESNVCPPGTPRRCAEATCFDGAKNGDETDKDCGGSCEKKCDPGKSCDTFEDCLQPPEADPSSSICQSKICVLSCAAGLDNCNQDPKDGCETNINTDIAHCGSCQSACDLSNVTDNKCDGGTCAIDFEAGGCTGSYLDVNGDPVDGCEVDSNTDVMHCGVENNVCSSAHGTPDCYGGDCSINCDNGFADCDMDPGSNGCEIDTDSSISHCGACNAVCTPKAGESASCDTSLVPACRSIACNGGSDCGGQQPCGACQSDGICNDLLNDVNNCGGCGLSCAASNATTECDSLGGGNVACAIASCVDSNGADYEDCDGNYTNGCEINVNSNVNHCGACNNQGGQNCATLKNNAALHIAAIQCSAKSCEITGCVGTYSDCDGNPNNGCEIDTSSANTRCGGCAPADVHPAGGVDCTTQWGNAFGTCQNSACVWGGCSSSNWGDCNNQKDTCETSLTTTSNCRACGVTCSSAGAGTTANICSGSGCSPTCAGGYGSCDSNPNNGCETSLVTSLSNCGACGNNCSTKVGQNSVTAVACAASSCDVTACSASRADCDNTFSNGCEVNTTNDAANCGGCNATASNAGAGDNCSSYIGGNGIASVSCTTSACKVASCSGSLADCNGNFFADGCEVNKNTDPNHCGACNNACVAKPNASVVCNAGVSCLYACEGSWIDGDGDLQTGTNGCESLAVTLVNRKTSTAAGPWGTILHSTGNLSFSHTLQSATGNYWMVAVAVGSQNSQAPGYPTGVTYGGRAMSLVEGITIGSSAASIWVIYETNQLSPGNHSVVVTAGNTWGATYAEAYEFKGVAQYSNVASVPGASISENTDCGADSSISTTVNAAARSYLLGIVAGQVTNGTSGGGSTPTGFTTEVTDLVFDGMSNNDLVIGSALTGQLAGGNTSVGFNVTSCFQKNLAVMEIRPGPGPG